VLDVIRWPHLQSNLFKIQAGSLTDLAVCATDCDLGCQMNGLDWAFQTLDQVDGLSRVVNVPHLQYMSHQRNRDLNTAADMCLIHS